MKRKNPLMLLAALNCLFMCLSGFALEDATEHGVCVKSGSSDQSPEFDYDDFGDSDYDHVVHDNAKYIEAEGNPYYMLVECVSTEITSCMIHPDTKVIGSYAFADCAALKQIVIPEGVTTIETGAFVECEGLETIYISASVIVIGEEAFDGCEKLAEVNYAGVYNEWYAIAFAEKNENLLDAPINFKKVCPHACKDATCTEPKTCTICGQHFGEKLGHDYVTTVTKATTTADGKIVTQCTRCQDISSKKTIYKVSSIKLSTTSYTYDGKVKTPTVSVKDSAGKTISSSSYTVTPASGRKNVGTYTVKVTMKGNYSGTKTLSFKINPISISKCKISLSATSYTYDGKVKTPTVTVKNASGTKLTKNTHYTVTYASGRKNAGTYTVKVTMKGNYSGTKTLSFKINPISISKCKISLSATSYTYDGKVKTPTVTVKNANGTKLTKNTHYTVTYASTRKNVGTHKVTVKMKGNYSGTKTLSYTIIPTAKTTAKLYVDETLKIGAKSNTTIKYSTSNSKIATVSSKGVISAKAAGTVTITVKSGSVSSKITVKVTKPPVSISTKTESVYRGNKLQLKATTSPSKQKVKWSVSNKNVATISSSGVLTAKKAGTVTVTATVSYKGKTYKDTHKVTVKTRTPSISVWVDDSYSYTDCPKIKITNKGSKSLKVLKKGSLSAEGQQRSFESLIFNGKAYSSYTIASGAKKEFRLKLKGGETILSPQTIYYVYFEYDGVTYAAYCDSSRSGSNKCVRIDKK